MSPPTLRTERALLRGSPGAVLAAVDEVGRGALAGPVAVGIVLVDDRVPPAPRGVRDSKACAPPLRHSLAPRIRRWARASAVGLASSAEIDSVGIIRALGMAAARALNGLGCRPDIVLLDGSHDWIGGVAVGSRVVMRVKADTTCAAVAAASILAKVHRDTLMESLAAGYPAYGWHANRGYAAPEHVDALARLGPSPLHRQSWRLPGLVADPA
ncbi:MAG: ribonuclease HII [bacterium]